jgi:glycosyltransferase involved in cell wall biosynthesis
MVGLFHTVPAERFSHCAFTGKVLRFPAMMQALGKNRYEVVEYANEGSESAAAVKVPILSDKEFVKLYPPRKESEFVGGYAKIGGAGHKAFEGKLIRELAKRVQRGDIICHPFGRAHMRLVEMFPEAIHVETGIGYSDAPFGCDARIYETNAWRSYHLGKHGEGPGNCNLPTSYVVPNYYDEKEWHRSTAISFQRPYVLMLGRICEAKGIETFLELALNWPEAMKRHGVPDVDFRIAGQGDPKQIKHAIDASNGRIRYHGSVSGPMRKALVSGASCMVMPSRFVEPFGGAGVEGLMCGVPLVASDIGGFPETTGLVCGPGNLVKGWDVEEWLRVVARAVAEGLHPGYRAAVSKSAHALFGMANVAHEYDRVFRHVVKTWREGRGLEAPEPETLNPPGPPCWCDQCRVQRQHTEIRNGSSVHCVKCGKHLGGLGATGPQPRIESTGPNVGSVSGPSYRILNFDGTYAGPHCPIALGPDDFGGTDDGSHLCHVGSLDSGD